MLLGTHTHTLRITTERDEQTVYGQLSVTAITQYRVDMLFCCCVSVQSEVKLWLGCTGWNWLWWCCDWVVQGGTDCGDVVIGLYRVELTVVMLWLDCTGWNWLWWCGWVVQGGTDCGDVIWLYWIHLDNVTVAQLFGKLPTSYYPNNSTPLVSMWSQINPISLRSYEYYFCIHVRISQMLSSRPVFSSNSTLPFSSPQYVLHVRPISLNAVPIFFISVVVLTTNEQFLCCLIVWMVLGERSITVMVMVQICPPLCHFFPLTLINTVCSNTLSLSSSHHTKYQVSHPYKPRGNLIITIGIQPLGRFGQRPEPSQSTGMAQVCCILGKFVGVACHCFPPRQPYNRLIINNDSQKTQLYL